MTHSAVSYLWNRMRWSNTLDSIVSQCESKLGPLLSDEEWVLKCDPRIAEQLSDVASTCGKRVAVVADASLTDGSVDADLRKMAKLEVVE